MKRIVRVVYSQPRGVMSQSSINWTKVYAELVL